jgi:hypothetical protein
MACVARIYGLRFALGVPFRAVYGNALNSAATFNALARYAFARIRGERLKWLKTDHAYPTRKLGEILVSSGYLPAPVVSSALADCSPGLRLGEFLVRTGRLSVDSLYKALALQQGLPVADVEPTSVPRGVARCLPEHVIRKWRLVPFQVAERNLFVASPEAPTSKQTAELRAFTGLEIRFHLVTPSKFDELAETLL